MRVNVNGYYGYYEYSVGIYALLHPRAGGRGSVLKWDGWMVHKGLEVRV